MSKATVCLIACFLVFTSASVQAQAPGKDRAIEAGRKALNGYIRFPWYDQERDTIRRIDVYPPQDVTARKSKWEVKPPKWSWPPWLTTLLEIIGWILLALAILLVIYALMRAVVFEGWRSADAESNENSLHGDIDRIEALPFQLQRPQTDLLAEARRHYEAGEYGQAIIYLYSYQLVQLDRHQLIRLSKGKTNRQYLREVRPRRNLFDLLARSMVTFEDVFFGHHTVDRERFESCWQRLDEFHQQLEQAAA